MKKYFITGVPGTGKSTTGEEIEKLGLASIIDIDKVEGLCSWMNTETLEIVGWSPGMSSDWFKEHEYLCDKEKLIGLIKGYKDSDVVVVGFPSNYSELWDLFDKVFLLQCKEEIIIERVIKRTSGDFGKNIKEQEFILSRYKDFEKDVLDKGALLVNSEESIDKVLEKIIREIKN